MFCLSVLCAGCATPGNSFERHSLSRLSEVPDSRVEFVFETRGVPGYERDDPAAEVIRMQWLSEWLSIRGACKEGYEVTERLNVDLQGYNSGQSEIRYSVRCRPDPGT